MESRSTTTSRSLGGHGVSRRSEDSPQRVADVCADHQQDQEVEFRVSVPGGTTTAAVDRYITCVQDFARALSRETSRLEEAERADVLERPEITATMVVKAYEEVRKPKVGSEPIPPWPLIAQVIAFAAAMLAGIFGSYLNSRWQWGATIGIASIGLFAQGYAIMALRRRR